jgi:hypothetical protein
LKALGTVGLVPNEAAVVHDQARAGDYEGALGTADRIPDRETKEHALGLIAWAQAEAGQIVAATKTAETIRSAEIQAQAIRRIGEAQAKVGDRSGAIAALRKITPNVDMIQGDTLRTIARDWAAFGDVKGAYEWVMARNVLESSRSRALLGVAEGMLPELELPAVQLVNP